MPSILLSLVFMFFLLSCAGNTVEPSEFERSSSSEANSSGISSSSSNTNGSSSNLSSSSSFETLPEVDERAPAGPSDLRVSPYLSAAPATIVLNWTDVDHWPRSAYSGYKIFRNDDYQGWQEIGSAVPEQQFYLDTSLPNTIYRAIYRVAAYGTAANGSDSLLSKFSNESGIVPLTTLGFGDIVFDQPEDIVITRWGPSSWEISWSHSGLNPEAGFVVQRLNPWPDSISTPSGSGVGQAIVNRGMWNNLDTLRESDNHFWVYGPMARGMYRVYAYYTEQFDRLISEFTAEVLTPVTYNSLITFLPPLVFPALLTPDTVDITWIGQHNQFVGASPDTAWYEARIVDGIQEIFETYSLTSMGRPYQIGSTCSFAISLRIAWRDRYGVMDYTAWSTPAGTKPGTQGELIDKNRLCTE